MAQDTLAVKVRAKYPGVYDDMDDVTLERAVRAKFPGIYDDIPSTGAAQPAAPAAQGGQSPFGAGGLQPGLDVLTGIAKGAANTVTGLGEAAYNYIPGVRQASDAVQRGLFGNVVPGEQTFGAARQAVQPTTPMQQLGFTGEQIGEYFIPAGRAARFARTGQAAQAGVTALAQTGDPTTAAVSAAAGPAVSLVTRAAGPLARSAQKTVAGALGATKEWAKSEAARLAPEILARGVRGSRAQMLDQARTMVTRVGTEIGAEIQAAAAAGQTVPGATVLQTIQTARDALLTPTATGQMIPIAGAEPVIRQLDRLQQFVARLPADLPVDQAAKIKTAWDRIVSKAGLYGPKAQASATDSAAAWSIREAATSMRNLLAQGNPTLDALNQEYAFWKGLRTVLAETERRTQAQGSGLISGVTGGAGFVTGLATGESLPDKMQDALVYGVAGRQLVRLLQSPSWATRVSAPLKQALADALVSGSVPRVQSVIQRITAALPAQVTR